MHLRKLCPVKSEPLQVPQILNPVVLVLDELPKLARDPQLGAYICASFGSVEAARKAILTDFCRHAFDGSGADVSDAAAPHLLLLLPCTAVWLRCLAAAVSWA